VKIQIPNITLYSVRTLTSLHAHLHTHSADHPIIYIKMFTLNSLQH